MASHYPIDHSETPIRLFKSDFMEFFTHISPVAVVIIWLPVAIWLLVSEILANRGLGWVYIPAGFVVGLFLWTFLEYMLHRFLFHYEATSERAQKVFYLFHGVHHHQPQCKTRLVMPPVVSIPMGLVVYGVMYSILSLMLGLSHWLSPVISGLIVGYLCYDLIHYATHHFAMRNGIWKALKRYHMQHHFKTPDARYGVSSPLWDLVFSTKPGG